MTCTEAEEGTAAPSVTCRSKRFLRHIRAHKVQRAEPNSYGGGNGGAYATIAVLQAGLALPAYLVPHEVRSRR